MKPTERIADTSCSGYAARGRARLSAKAGRAPSRHYVLAALLAVGAAVGLLAPSANAAVTHDYLFQFNEVPSSSGAPIPGPLTEVGWMTVDSGEVWIAEHVEGATNYRVDRFNAGTGEFISQFAHAAGSSHEYLGVAVGHLAGEAEPQVYLGEVGAVSVASEGGSSLGTWTGAETPAKALGAAFGVAVDNRATGSGAGNVYVTDTEHNVVDVFQPEAGTNKGHEKYVTQLTGTCATPASCTENTFTNPQRVAVNSANGDVLVADGSVVDVFEPTLLDEYVFVRQLTGFALITGVAVDSGTGDIYVANSVEPSENKHADSVEQFSSEGVFRGSLKGTSAGPFVGVVDSVAVDSTSHDVYVGVRAEPVRAEPGFVDVFGESVVVPDVVTDGATEVKPTSATLNGRVNPLEAETAEPATCRFMWGTSESLGKEAACPEPVKGNSLAAVHAPLESLLPDTTYYYRLQASNGKGTNLSEEATAQCNGQSSQDACFTTSGPGIHSESVSEVASTSATLEATIDPNGVSTSYHFEYDTTVYGTSAAHGVSGPVPNGTLGAGAGDVPVGPQHVQGLSAGTIYHYRVVAESEPTPGKLERFDGPDRTFTTQPPGAGLGLPDSRQWELVTPPNKHGATILPREGGSYHATGVTQAAEDGSGIVYRTDAPTEPEPPGYGQLGNFADSVLSVRGAAGWSTRDIATPHNSPTNVIGIAEYLSFAGDLSAALANPEGEDLTLLSSEASEPTPYIRREALCDSPATAHECYWPVLTGKEGVADVPPGTEFGPVPPEGGSTGVHTPRVDVAGVSPDLRHVLVKPRHGLALTATPIPGAGPGGGQIYEWTAGVPGDEALQLASTLPASEGGGPASAEELAVGGGTAEFYGPHAQGARHAVSNDGSRVFWEARDDSQRMRRLYLRDTLRRETVRLDVPQPGAPSGGTPFARFEIASTDGSKVFFTDEQRLTVDSGARSAGPDLYECEIVEQAGRLACSLKDLTPAREGHSAEVRNMVSGAAEDGSSVYFVANGVLNESTNSQGESADQGTCVREGPPNAKRACNLYEYHQGVVTFIATLSQRDENAWGIENSPPPGGLPNPQYVHSLTAYASPDGRYLTFMSFRSLTGYDNRDAISGKPDAEVYLYDAARGRLSCASCNPTGARPHGIEAAEFGLEGKTRTHVENLASVRLDDTGVEGIHSWVAANLPPGDKIGLFDGGRDQPRPLSGGGRVFFNSSDALVPRDVNGNEDVYEFEPEGTGSCTASSVTFSSSSSGCVSLISSGTSPEESGFLDASKSGSDVFFLTNSSLVSGDTDTSRDVYDAHVCTASAPCPAATVTVPGCATGDACRGTPSPQPSIFGAPASATFTGAGNVVAGAPVPRVTGRRLTRAQQLARALRACHKQPTRKRAACVRQARKRFGAVKTGGSVRATTKARG